MLCFNAYSNAKTDLLGLENTITGILKALANPGQSDNQAETIKQLVRQVYQNIKSMHSNRMNQVLKSLIINAKSLSHVCSNKKKVSFTLRCMNFSLYMFSH